MSARRISRSVYRRQASRASASLLCSDKEARVSSLNATQRSVETSKAAPNIDMAQLPVGDQSVLCGAELRLLPSNRAAAGLVSASRFACQQNRAVFGLKPSPERGTKGGREWGCPWSKRLIGPSKNDQNLCAALKNA